MSNVNSSFDQLIGKWHWLGNLGREAEKYVNSDPSVTLIKLRLFAEKMIDEILRLEEIDAEELNDQMDKLTKLKEEELLSTEILDICHDIRLAGNRAAHQGEGTSEEANILIDKAAYLGFWFYFEYDFEFSKFRREAKKFMTSDPSVALIKLRLFAEKMIDEILRLEEINAKELDDQTDKLTILEEKELLAAKQLELFYNIRRAGNRAAIEGYGTTEDVDIFLDQASCLKSWFIEKYAENNNLTLVHEQHSEEYLPFVQKSKSRQFFEAISFFLLSFAIVYVSVYSLILCPLFSLY